MIYELWERTPVPIWAANTGDGNSPDLTDDPVMALMMLHRGGITFRAVGLERLPTILTNGVDVEPTDSIIYCDLLQKAYEYGGDPKVVMVFRYFDPNSAHLTRGAITHIMPNTSPEDEAERRTLYPFVVGQPKPDVTRLCRVEPTTQGQYNYLAAYGYFIPGNPWDALVGIFIYGDEPGLAQAREVVADYISSSTATA